MKSGQNSVLLVLDMQHDFCDRDGVFARNGFDVSGIEEIIPRIDAVMKSFRARSLPIVASKLTILEDIHGRPMGMGSLARLRPFLVEDGFRDGSVGQSFIPQLPRPDYEVRKWGHSAFHLSELEKMLQALGAEKLIVVGIATNGVVEATVREAVTREYDVTVLEDCVAAYHANLHRASLENMGFFARLLPHDEFLSQVSGEGAAP